MIDYKSLAELIFWISVIMLSPGIYCFTRALVRYLFFRFISNEKIIVTIKRADAKTKSVEIKATGYVVDQIRNQFKAGET